MWQRLYVKFFTANNLKERFKMQELDTKIKDFEAVKCLLIFMDKLNARAKKTVLIPAIWKLNLTLGDYLKKYNGLHLLRQSETYMLNPSTQAYNYFLNVTSDKDEDKLVFLLENAISEVGLIAIQTKAKMRE